LKVCLELFDKLVEPHCEIVERDSLEHVEQLTGRIGRQQMSYIQIAKSAILGDGEEADKIKAQKGEVGEHLLI
ncbi:MAG: hypothetical protein AB7F94_01095, partial [Nitrospira sp.]